MQLVLLCEPHGRETFGKLVSCSGNDVDRRKATRPTFFFCYLLVVLLRRCDQCRSSLLDFLLLCYCLKDGSVYCMLPRLPSVYGMPRLLSQSA
jgi:hypothetical protein